MLLAVLSLCVLCGCGLASESQTNANGDTKSQTEDNSAGKQKEKIVVGTPDNLEVSVNGEYAIISWGQGKHAKTQKKDRPNWRDLSPEVKLSLKLEPTMIQKRPLFIPNGRA